MKNLLKYSLSAITAFLIIVIAIYWKNDIDLNELKDKYAYPSSSFISIDGINVHYRDVGKGEAILLIHGTGASLHTWEKWIDILSPGYRVISFDLPGFGLTGPDPNHNYQISRYTVILDSLMVKLKVDSFHIAGNSLGGLVAWRYTTQFPQKILTLNLIDAAGLPQPGKKPPFIFQLAKLPVLSTLMQKVTPKSIIKNSMLDVYKNDQLVTEKLIDRYFELSLKEGNRTAFVKRMSQLNEKLDINDLKRITAPVLIQWGKDDRWIPLAKGYEFKKIIPKAELKIYNSGHVPMEENPMETVEDYMIFLKKSKED
ncbi:MAG: alpha/beta hydrolase [Saprospiraceae bacterium]|nr:alpha/beta hydrolase [Saprospiraceae bacterium]